MWLFQCVAVLVRVCRLAWIEGGCFLADTRRDYRGKRDAFHNVSGRYGLVLVSEQVGPSVR